MASRALAQWFGGQAEALDELVRAHQKVGGTGPGRRYATEQINYAYLLAVAAQFQKFCRDLHSEAAQYVVDNVQPASYQILVSAALTQGRQLDRGNAQSSSIGADFGRFDMEIWDDVLALDTRNTARKEKLDQLNTWRNAIAHQDFNFRPHEQAIVAGTDARLKFVRRWRNACDYLARALDQAVRERLAGLVGTSPW